jgi:hypothetical protein
MNNSFFFTNKIWFLYVVVIDMCVGKEIVAGKTLGCVSQQPNSDQAHKSKSIEMFLRPTDPTRPNSTHITMKKAQTETCEKLTTIL